MAVQVLDGMPWSLPGSRIFGLITESGLSIYSAEYETPLDKSLLMSLRVVRSSAGFPLAPEHLDYGVVSWGKKLELTFSGLSGVQFINISGEPLHLDFLIGAEKSSTDSPKLTDHSNQRFRLSMEEDLSLPDQGHYDLTLQPNQIVKMHLTESGSELHQMFIDSDSGNKIWREWMDKRPTVAAWIQGAVDTSWYCLGVNSIYLRWGPIRNKLAIVPSVLGYVGIWQWDSYFISIGVKHGDYQLAKEQLELVLGFAKTNGQLQDVIHDSGILSSFSDLPAKELESYAKSKGMKATQLSAIPITKPPLATWAVNDLAKFSGDEALYLQFFATLVAQHNWWWSTAKASSNGLPCYQHPYSSGLDDSPSFDDFQPATPPDLISYLLLEGRLLIKIAETFGLTFDIELQQTRQAILSAALEKSWDETNGIYRTFIDEGFNKSKTVLTMITLINTLEKKNLDLLIGMLNDVKKFGGQLTIPTVSRDDENYSPEKMWRGPIWINTNFLVIEGLQENGEGGQAKALALKTLELISASNGCFEYYDSLSGQPATSAVGCFSWTAALCIDLAVRYAPVK